jgi:sugar phosphate isomerase/epimerase
MCLNLTTLLRADLKEGIRAARQAGFDAVELWVDSLEKYLETNTTDDLCTLLHEHSMKAISIGDFESITFCTPEQFDELCRRFERMASVAKAIACPTLVASASVRPRGADSLLVANETASTLGRLLNITEPQDVGLAFAFRGFKWCAVNSFEGACEAIAAHGGRMVGVALDTFDLHATGVQPEKLKSIDPSVISVMRMSDCADVAHAILSETDRVLPGEGVARLDAMLEAVWSAGFSGPISLKILSPALWSLKAEEIARIVMAVASQYFPRPTSPL